MGLGDALCLELDASEEIRQDYLDAFRRAAVGGVDFAGAVDGGSATAALRTFVDGPTAVVNYPLVAGKTKSGHPFQGRAIAAICSGDLGTSDMSTKVWGRVSLPFNSSTNGSKASPPVDGEKLGEVFSEYRQIGVTIVQWAFDRLAQGLGMHSRTGAESVHYRFSREAPDVEIVTFGVEGDRNLERDLRTLNDTEFEFAEGLIDAEDATPDRVVQYINKILGVEETLEGSGPADGPGAYWNVFDVRVRDADGYAEVAEVMYLMQDGHSVVRAVGVGYDPSAKRNLAHRASLQAAFWLGARM